MERETIYKAVFDKLATLTVGATPAFTTASRVLKSWSDVAAIEQPALFMAQTGETPTQKRGFPTVWTLGVDVYVYVNRGGDLTLPPGEVLNPILDAIDNLFKPDYSGVCDLGMPEIISHCWIAGRIETDEGALGSQGVAIVPIEILVTG